jgi:DNA-binding NtrC family response regulator
MALIRQLRALRPNHPLLVLTTQTSVAAAVAAMRAGANDFLVKPIAPDRLLAALEAITDRRKSSGELRPLSEKITKQMGFDEIVGSSPQFRSALAIAAKAARARVPVLIEGESGTGKEILAQAIHAASPRGKKELHVVNCGAIPATSSNRSCSGTKRAASPAPSTAISAGSRMPTAPPCSWTRSASSRSRRRSNCSARSRAARSSAWARASPTRSTCASSPPPIAASTEEVAAERFREDLFYRLNVVNVSIPPLRDRITDLPALARHLLVRIAEQPGMRYLSITDDALAVLMSYGWPGNVRQLQNALFRAAVLCDRDALTGGRFPHIATEAAYGRRQDDYHAKRLNGASQSAAMEHGPASPLRKRRPRPEARRDRGRRHPPRHRPLSRPHDRSRPPPRHRPLHLLPQARRTRHRERGLELANNPHPVPSRKVEDASHGAPTTAPRLRSGDG